MKVIIKIINAYLFPITALFAISLVLTLLYKLGVREFMLTPDDEKKKIIDEMGEDAGIFSPSFGIFIIMANTMFWITIVRLFLLI